MYIDEEYSQYAQKGKVLGRAPTSHQYTCTIIFILIYSGVKIV